MAFLIEILLELKPEPGDTEPDVTSEDKVCITASRGCDRSIQRTVNDGVRDDIGLTHDFLRELPKLLWEMLKEFLHLHPLGPIVHEQKCHRTKYSPMCCHTFLPA